VEILSFIKDVVSTVGFPIAVALYMLVNFRRTIDKLSDSLDRNSEVMKTICEVLKLSPRGEK